MVVLANQTGAIFIRFNEIHCQFSDKPNNNEVT